MTDIILYTVDISQKVATLYKPYKTVTLVDNISEQDNILEEESMGKFGNLHMFYWANQIEHCSKVDKLHSYCSYAHVHHYCWLQDT